MSTKTNTSAVDDVLSTGRMGLNKSQTEGAGLTINSLP